MSQTFVRILSYLEKWAKLVKLIEEYEFFFAWRIEKSEEKNIFTLISQCVCRKMGFT